MKKYFYLLAISFITFSCNSGDIAQTPTNPCDDNVQGFSYSNNTENYTIDDQSITVQLITGHPQGDYFHIFTNNGNPNTNFFTFAINSGNTSTLDQNWNTTAGSFLSVNNNPVYDNPPNTINLTTVESGSQVGDRILIEFSGTLPQVGLIEGQYCVTIDEIISINNTTNYVYIVDGTDFKIVNVNEPLLPFIETTIPASTAHFVEVIDHKAYIGYYNAIEPFINYYDVSNAANSNLIYSIPKISGIGGIGILSDIEKIGNLIYTSDEIKGVHRLDPVSNIITPFENHDVMSLSLINNKLTCLGVWAGLYGWDVSTPNQPNNLNYRIDNLSQIDIASYPSIGGFGSWHSWIRNDGTYHYVANIIDKKLKKIEEGALNYSVINEVDIIGYATAFEIAGNIGYITTRSRPQAPLQGGLERIVMVDLTTMAILATHSLADPSGVAIIDDMVYVPDRNGLHIFDVSQGNLNLINSYAPGFGRYISKNNL